MRQTAAGVEKQRSSVVSNAMLLEPLQIRPKLSYNLTKKIISMDSTFCHTGTLWATKCQLADRDLLNISDFADGLIF